MTYSAAIFPELDADLKDGRHDGQEEKNNGGIGLRRIMNGLGLGLSDGASGSVNGEANGKKAGESKSNGNDVGQEEIDELEQAQLAKLRWVSGLFNLVRNESLSPALTARHSLTSR